MPLLSLPNELLLLISSFTDILAPRDIRALILTNRRFANLFSAVLSALMLDPQHSIHALFYAAARRNTSETQLLLTKGTGIWVVIERHNWCCYIRDGHDREYPLEYHGADPLLLNFVLELGPNLALVLSDDLDENVYVTAIVWAVRSRSLALLRLILSNVEDLHSFSLGNGVYEACRIGYAPAVALILDMPKVPAALPSEGGVLGGSKGVFKAAEGGHWEVLQLLLDARAETDDPESLEKMAARAVDVALRHGHNKAAGVLLKYVNEESFIDYKHRRAFFLAAELDEVDLLQGFLDNGVGVGKKDKHKRTALHCAAKMGAINAIRVLVANGADIEACDNLRRRPIHAAARFACEAMHVLVEMGADVTAADINGTTALHSVTKRGTDEDVEVLVKRGASLDLQDNAGRAPRYWIDVKEERRRRHEEYEELCLQIPE